MYRSMEPRHAQEYGTKTCTGEYPTTNTVCTTAHSHEGMFWAECAGMKRRVSTSTRVVQRTNHSASHDIAAVSTLLSSYMMTSSHVMTPSHNLTVLFSAACPASSTPLPGATPLPPPPAPLSGVLPLPPLNWLSS